VLFIIKAFMELTDCTDRIIAEAARLFMVYGTKAVTMDMLANRLGISKRTLYEKFRDKDELLAKVLKCMFEKQKILMDNLIASEPNVLAAFFKHGQKMKEHFGSMNPILVSDLKRFHIDVLKKIKDSCGNQYQSSMAFVLKGIEQGVIRKDIDPEIVNRCFYEMGKMIKDSEMFPPEQFSQGALIKNVIFNYLRGIVTEEGMKVLLEYENII